MKSRALRLTQGEVQSPIFLPDATFGVVRSVDAEDLIAVGIQALVMNTFHLMQRPGSSTIQALGGLHQMAHWKKNIVTDSGGFQAYSLIRQNPRFGRIHDKGIIFAPEGSSRKFQLTPEKTIRLQISYGSDVVICLDDCTHVDEGYKAQLESVDRTIAWAKKSKKEYAILTDQKKLTEQTRPRIYAVVQGGGYKDLRLKCVEALLEIGFDGYGYGGWPLDKDNHLLSEIIGYTREIVPAEYHMHALGVGHPENLLACFELGYDIFDSAMPTRDARHGRLFTFKNPSDPNDFGLTGAWFGYKYINDEENIKANLPISAYCDCPCCKNYSMGYLHHLFKQGDALFMRLATLHNLRFMVQLCERIQRKYA
ncbi:MAG: tRNA-guanine transglycosylase various specificitie [Chloroflexi bacterium]|nr:MAG: tRNA-guanine transglycosylase various specificitie [Chloroflexota bacterium]MBA4376380.1 tRNA-guanine transglycosylase [Anaerolinea sp.]